jgi:lipopolysaccharide export system permease protein
MKLDPEDVSSELNYRIVRALTVLFLPLLAIPMGLSSRRSPASIRIVAGIAILIFYFQALQFGQDMAKNGRISSFVGLWVPFLVFATGSTYAFHLANSGLGSDPFSALFGLIDDIWAWCKRRWNALLPRRRAA